MSRLPTSASTATGSIGRLRAGRSRRTRPDHPVLAPVAVLAAVTVAASLGSAASAQATAAAPAARAAFGASAYASFAHLGSTVNSGRTAELPICTTHTGLSRIDRTAALTLPAGLGTIGAAVTQVRTSTVHGQPRSVAMTRTEATSVLDAVRATALTTTASVTRTASGYALAADTTLLGLRIGGQLLPAHPSIRQTVTIPGVATVVLNDQRPMPAVHAIAVTAVTIHVLSAASGLPGLPGVPATPGGQILIGHSVASLSSPVHHLAYGSAYGTSVQAGTVVRSGRTAPVFLPCGGTAGTVSTANATVGLHLPGAAVAGVVKSFGRSRDGAAATAAVTGSRVAGVNLLDGLITARAVVGYAHVTRMGRRLSRSSQGTQFVGLEINGSAGPRTVAVNSSYDLAGVGTLYLNSVARTPTGMVVTGLRLVLSTATDGLDAGTVISVAVAHSGVLAS